jgi:glycosyltransferase involved in cell wall biosynthesis
LAVNGRFRVHRITGVQRYAHEIVTRLGSEVEVLAPASAKGALGHLWEQTVLPAEARGRLLWSPCGSGPVGYRRQVVTFHDLFPLEHPEWYSPAYSRWYSLVMRRLAAEALHVFAVSEYTKSRLVALLGRNPQTITVIPNGLKRNFQRASISAMEHARHALGLPGPRYILSLSSLEKRKNLTGILQAWSHVWSKLPADVWLVLAGPKADEAVYGKQNIHLHPPRVFFAGYVPEHHLAGVYSGASLFLFPSLAEGFGLPLLEAMACGVRCITSRTTSLPEVGGDAVEYVDATDARALAGTILRQWQEHGRCVPFLPAVERAQRFTWDEAARRTHEVLSACAVLDPAFSYVRTTPHARSCRPTAAPTESAHTEPRAS